MKKIWLVLVATAFSACSGQPSEEPKKEDTQAGGVLPTPPASYNPLSLPGGDVQPDPVFKLTDLQERIVISMKIFGDLDESTFREFLDTYAKDQARGLRLNEEQAKVFVDETLARSDRARYFTVYRITYEALMGYSAIGPLAAIASVNNEEAQEHEGPLRTSSPEEARRIAHSLASRNDAAKALENYFFEK